MADAVYKRGVNKGKSKKAVKAWKRALKRIPEFECITGCVDCCRTRNRENMLLYSRDGQIVDIKVDHYRTYRACAALEKKFGCMEYSTRPLICRLYGVSELLPCKRGKKPTRMLTKEETVEIVRSLWGTVPKEWVG